MVYTLCIYAVYSAQTILIIKQSKSSCLWLRLFMPYIYLHLSDTYAAEYTAEYTAMKRRCFYTFLRDVHSRISLGAYKGVFNYKHTRPTTNNR